MAKRIPGYLVLDEGRPLRVAGDRYVNFGKHWPIALFAGLTVARRVRGMLQYQHRAVANSLDPNAGPDQKRVHDKWNARAAGVEIQRAGFAAPTAADIRKQKEAYRG